MAEEDCVTTTICPNSRRKGEPKLGTHQKSYLVSVDGKIEFAQQFDGKPCPVEAFICKKGNISCTVCGVVIEIGAVVCLHSAFYIMMRKILMMNRKQALKRTLMGNRKTLLESLLKVLPDECKNYFECLQ